MFIDTISLHTSPALPTATITIKPPYTVTSALPIRFELPYVPLSESNPTIPIYRSSKFLPPQEDGSPPEYRPVLRSASVGLKPNPSHLLQFDPRTKGIFVTSPEGVKVAFISFTKHRTPTVTTYHSLNQTIEETEDGETQAELFQDQEEISSIVDTDTHTEPEDGLPKETITLSSHKFFRSKKTNFITENCQFRWQRSSKHSNELALYRTFLKPITADENKTVNSSGRGQIVGRIGISEYDSSIVVLEMEEEIKGSLSEAMFLGSAIAVLKKSDLRVARKPNFRLSA
ncbi:hypothetical protein ABW20_dc0105012 [Dactylellina cionopaga]|nr:hypothetical protein ABW20_dc0105012 [Dactylellina cionopaga]